MFHLSVSVSVLYGHVSKLCTGRSAGSKIFGVLLSGSHGITLRAFITGKSIFFVSQFFWYIVSVVLRHSLDEMPVSQDETTLSRGRLPSYLCRQVHQLMSVLLHQRAGRGQRNNQLCLLSPGILYYFIARNHNRSSSLLLNSHSLP
jgi:hypothetical protein